MIELDDDAAAALAATVVAGVFELLLLLMLCDVARRSRLEREESWVERKEEAIRVNVTVPDPRWAEEEEEEEEEDDMEVEVEEVEDDADNRGDDLESAVALADDDDGDEDDGGCCPRGKDREVGEGAVGEEDEEEEDEEPEDDGFPGGVQASNQGAGWWCFGGSTIPNSNATSSRSALILPPLPPPPTPPTPLLMLLPLPLVMLASALLFPESCTTPPVLVRARAVTVGRPPPPTPLPGSVVHVRSRIRSKLISCRIWSNRILSHLSGSVSTTQFILVKRTFEQPYSQRLSSL